MKRLLCIILVLCTSGCYKNGRDAQEPHQIVAEPANKWIHWQQEEPVDVTNERETSVKPCQNVNA